MLFRHERSWHSDLGVQMMLTVREHNQSGCRLRSYRVMGGWVFSPTRLREQSFHSIVQPT